MSEEVPTQEFIQQLEEKYNDALQGGLRRVENALEIPVCTRAEFRMYENQRRGLVLWYMDEDNMETEIEVYWQEGSDEAHGHELDQLYAFQLGLEAVKAYKKKFFDN